MTNKTNSFDLLIGYYLRDRRKGLSLSQLELAAQLNTTIQTIKEYEDGLARIHTSELYRLAQILGVETNYFFDGFLGEENRDFGEQRKNQMPAEEELRLIRLIFKTSDPVIRERLFVLFQKVKNSYSL